MANVVTYEDLARLEEKLKRIIALTEERLKGEIKHLDRRIDDVDDWLRREL